MKPLQQPLVVTDEKTGEDVVIAPLHNHAVELAALVSERRALQEKINVKKDEILACMEEHSVREYNAGGVVINIEEKAKVKVGPEAGPMDEDGEPPAEEVVH